MTSALEALVDLNISSLREHEAAAPLVDFSAPLRSRQNQRVPSWLRLSWVDGQGDELVAPP